MTLFEFMVPVVALSVAGLGVLVIHIASRRLDRAQKREHPAE